VLNVGAECDRFYIVGYKQTGVEWELIGEKRCFVVRFSTKKDALPDILINWVKWV
jgi:hypothetical protein